MNEFQLVQTVIAMRDFYAPEGVEVAVVVWPKPGVCLVSVEMWVGPNIRFYRFQTPPTEEVLRALYLEANDLLEASKRNDPGSMLGIDLATVGGDG